MVDYCIRGWPPVVEAAVTPREMVAIRAIPADTLAGDDSTVGERLEQDAMGPRRVTAGRIGRGRGDLRYAQTVAFTTLMLAQLFNTRISSPTAGYGARSRCRSRFRRWCCLCRPCSWRSGQSRWVLPTGCAASRWRAPFCGSARRTRLSCAQCGGPVRDRRRRSVPGRSARVATSAPLGRAVRAGSAAGVRDGRSERGRLAALPRSRQLGLWLRELSKVVTRPSAARRRHDAGARVRQVTGRRVGRA
jgi:hypothetical protein